MSSFAKLKPDALGELLATLEERDLLRLDCAFCNTLERPLYLEALAHIDSGPLLKARYKSKPKWERLFSWLCLRGVPAPKAIYLPREADDDTMSLIVEQCSTLANVQIVALFNASKLTSKFDPPLVFEGADFAVFSQTDRLFTASHCRPSHREA
jgi:hypothetical protein